MIDSTDKICYLLRKIRPKTAYQSLQFDASGTVLNWNNEWGTQPTIEEYEEAWGFWEDLYEGDIDEGDSKVRDLWDRVNSGR